MELQIVSGVIVAVGGSLMWLATWGICDFFWFCRFGW